METFHCLETQQFSVLIIELWSWQVRLQELFKEEGCDAKLRLNEDGKPYVTDNLNYIVDLYLKTPIKDGLAAGKEISVLEGVVEHGLFLDMVTAVIIAGKSGVEVKNKWDIIHGGRNHECSCSSPQGFEVLRCNS